MKETVTRYQVTLAGASPLLMHSDNPNGADMVKKWSKDPQNRKQSVAGDDRTPSWTWLTYVYHDGKNLCIPTDNIMSMLRDAGTQVPNPNKRGSLKTQTQAGIIADGFGWALQVNGKQIPWSKLEPLFKEPDFEKHEEKAKELGFSLFLKRARISQNKHIRIRPMFENWTVTGNILVFDPQLTHDVIEVLFRQAGFFVGLCDWRPGSRTPGQFGRFEAAIEKLSK